MLGGAGVQIAVLKGVARVGLIGERREVRDLALGVVQAEEEADAEVLSQVQTEGPCSGAGYTGRRVSGGECGEAVLALEGIMSFPRFSKKSYLGFFWSTCFILSVFPLRLKHTSAHAHSLNHKMTTVLVSHGCCYEVLRTGGA